MTLLTVFRTAIFLALITATAVGADSTPTYEKGTLAKQLSSGHKSYDLKGDVKSYRINNCGDFQDGQQVDYRVDGSNIYIRREGSKDYKCNIEATYEPNTQPTLPLTYEKGTIEGFETQRHYGANNSVRKAKVYELHGLDLIYRIDYCGAFQAGQFSPGQVVEYRVVASENRLYILHDTDKEYSCQIEGRRKPENTNTETAAQSAAPSPAAPTSAPAPSTAKFSIASIPDGADIEVDGNFSGNTPSDLEVPEGEHSITVKKSGYKDWQRKIRVVAGSNIRLNAEMEKTTNP